MSQVIHGPARRGHRVPAGGPIPPDHLEGGDAFAERSPELEVHRFVMPFLDVAPDVSKPDYHDLQERQTDELTHRLIEDRRPDLVIAGRESFVRHIAAVAAAHGIP